MRALVGRHAVLLLVGGDKRWLRATNEAGHPVRVKLSTVAGINREAIAHWAKANLLPGTDVRSRDLSCFAGVFDAGCAYSYIVDGRRKPRDLPQLTWVNTILGNLKTMINGGYKAFKFNKYASHYLGAFAYRFNLPALLGGLLGNAPTSGPTREHQIRDVAETHD